MFQQLPNLSSSQWDTGGPILGALSNNRWSGGIWVNSGIFKGRNLCLPLDTMISRWLSRNYFYLRIHSPSLIAFFLFFFFYSFMFCFRSFRGIVQHLRSMLPHHQDTHRRFLLVPSCACRLRCCSGHPRETNSSFLKKKKGPFNERYSQKKIKRVEFVNLQRAKVKRKYLKRSNAQQMKMFSLFLHHCRHRSVTTASFRSLDASSRFEAMRDFLFTRVGDSAN